MISFDSDPSDGPDRQPDLVSPPPVFGKKAGFMAFSVPYVLFAAFALWLLLTGLQHLLRANTPGAGIETGDGQRAQVVTRAGSLLAARAYATASSEVHRLPRERT